MNGLPLEDIIEWDVTNWSRAIEFWSANTSLNLSQTLALEVGARNGGLSLWLALQKSNVICSDLTRMDEAAKQKHRKHGVSRLIRYESVDITDMPYEDAFDLIVFKSVLGGLDGLESQKRAVENIFKALKPEGECFFVENLSASRFHMLMRGIFKPWGKTWRYLSIKEIDTLFAGFSQMTYATEGVLGCLGTNESLRRMLGVLDIHIFNHLVRKDWQYIIMGIAKKGR